MTRKQNNKQLLMGNEAIGLAAIAAGVSVVVGYPGTPSTEVLETVAKYNDGNIYVEWSVNEKVAMEVAAGACYTGARTMVTMKQVGLSVASDPLMCLSSVGVKGGLVVLVADDPGPISSQTEQDSRHFARYANLPVFDPSSPEEAYQMVGEAFATSEKFGLPVLLRPTTRICHACSVVETHTTMDKKPIEGFVKDSNRWVIFPRLAYENHIKHEDAQMEIAKHFDRSPFNTVTGEAKNGLGIAASGIGYAYAKEAVDKLGLHIKLLKVGTPYPFPQETAKAFCQGLHKILVIEELDGVVEEELVKLCGRQHLAVDVLGKDSRHLPVAGEYTLPIVEQAIAKFAGISLPPQAMPELPPLPVRPPVLCAGCPHRASFYAVKQAMKKQPFVCTGDIGCYTLGNAKPLDMVDTCLCMGGGITVAQGISQAGNDSKQIAFIGDSTFFHSGITGVVNAVYNKADITVIIVDNSTTAMTGHQPHPGTGKTMMKEVTQAVDLEAVLRGCGVQKVDTLSPLDLPKAIETVKDSVAYPGVSAIIFRAPCIALFKPEQTMEVKENCTNCKRCIKEIGCPALVTTEGKDGKPQVAIEPTLCYGCGLCAHVCPCNAIGGARHE